MRHLGYILGLVLIGCTNNTQSDYLAVSISEEKIIQEHPGKRLMETYCYACHTPETQMENRLALPMIAVKRHYISENTTKEEFQKEMLYWINNPTEANSKMPGAIRRFGVMPNQKFSEDIINSISEYIFENEIEEPIWFEDHFQKRKGRGNH